MDSNNRSTQENDAWAVASDPAASETKWLAACTLLEGRTLPSVRKNIHPGIGLVWSLTVSGLSGLGAFMIFGFLSAAVCEAAAALTGSFYTFSGPHAFALLSAAFITFSAIFTFQQFLWSGGKTWSGLHYGLVVCGALLPFALELMFATPASLGNLCLFALWGSGFIGLSALSANMTRATIQRLESTVGARRVLPHTRTLFAFSGSLLLLLTGAPSVFTVFASMWFWLPALLIGSGYYIAHVNKAANPQTATALAVCAWNPLLLANLVLLPALLINSIFALFFPILQIALADYAVAVATMICIALGPLVGARLAARNLQRSLALELHKMPNLQAMPALTGRDEPICEST